MRAGSMTYGIRSMSALLAGALLALSMGASPAVADETTYQVRVFAGTKGAVEGQDAVTIECRRGQPFDLDEIGVEVEADGYYHKGFREAGKDEEFPYKSFDVDRDIDLVAAYGMQGNMVKLTVHLREWGTKRPLVASDGTSEMTYEYKVGDKPVVAFRHVEGYRPLWRNITGTLTEDTEWYLDYAPLAPGESEDDALGQQGDASTGEAGQGGTAMREGGTAGSRPADRQDGTGDDASPDGTADGNAESGELSGQTSEEPPATREILDNDVPLARPDGDGSKSIFPWEADTKGESLAPAIVTTVLIVGVLAIVVTAAGALGRRRRD